jgi:ABC-2 type transport system permease protein
MATLMRLELLLLLRNRGFVALALVVLGLLVLAVLTGQARVASIAATYEAVRAEDEARYRKLADELEGIESGRFTPGRFSDPRNVGRVGRDLGKRHAILPLRPLAALANGDADLRPSYYLVSSHHFSSFAGEYELRNPLGLATGALDVAFVIGVVLPLAIIALGAPLFVPPPVPAIERMFSASVIAASRRYRARVAVLGIVALAITVVTLFVVPVALEARAPLAEWSAFGALLLGYCTVWIGLVALVGVWCNRVTTALAAALCAWALATFAGPALIGTAADRAHPIPSRVALLVAEREALLESDRKHASLLARYLHDHPEAAAPGEKVDIPEWLTRFYIQQIEIDAQASKWRERIAAIKADRHALLARIQWMLPGLAFESALQHLAGSHPRRYAAFESAVATYHGDWQAFFLPRVLNRTPFRAQDLERVPRYLHVEEAGAGTRIALRTAFAFVAMSAGLLLAAAARSSGWALGRRPPTRVGT